MCIIKKSNTTLVPCFHDAELFLAVLALRAHKDSSASRFHSSVLQLETNLVSVSCGTLQVACSGLVKLLWF